MPGLRSGYLLSFDFLCLVGMSWIIQVSVEPSTNTPPECSVIPRPLAPSGRQYSPPRICHPLPGCHNRG